MYYDYTPTEYSVGVGIKVLFYPPLTCVNGG